MTHATRTLESHNLSGEKIDFGSHTYFSDSQGHGGPPRWVISSMPGHPPRQHEHKRRYTPLTHPLLLTSWIWKDDYDGQVIFGDLVGFKLPVICLTDEKKPRKNLTQETFSRAGIEPGPAACQARMLPPAPQRWTCTVICISFPYFPIISSLKFSPLIP